MIELETIRDEVNNLFDVDICKRSRERKYAYARKVYCYITCGLTCDKQRYRNNRKYTLKTIGELINMPHHLVIHHLKTIDVVDRQHKLFANRIIDKYNFNTKKLDVKELKEIEVVCKNEISYNNVALQIAEQLSELPEKEILDFKNNKFDIFMKVARSRNYQKKFEEVKGAAILRK